MSNLVTRSELARRAGVNKSNATRFAKKHPEILVGNLVDLDHPEVQQYLSRDKVHEVPSGGKIKVDPLYGEAYEYANEIGRLTLTSIRRKFKISASRAEKILNMIKDSGVKLGGYVPPAPGTKKAPVVQKEKPAAKSVPPKNREQQTVVGRLTEIDKAAKKETLRDEIRNVLNWTLQDILDVFGTEAAFSAYLKAAKTMEEINDKRLKNAKISGELVSRENVKAGIFDPLEQLFGRLLRDGSRTVTQTIIQRVKASATAEECEAEVRKQLTAFIKTTKGQLARGMENL